MYSLNDMLKFRLEFGEINDYVYRSSKEHLGEWSGAKWASFFIGMLLSAVSAACFVEGHCLPALTGFGVAALGAFILSCISTRKVKFYELIIMTYNHSSELNELQNLYK